MKFSDLLLMSITNLWKRKLRTVLTVLGLSLIHISYYKQNNLTNYTISEKIKEIGRLSFAQSGLQSIEIPSNVTTIDYGAFYGCQDLKEVTIPDSVISIGTKACILYTSAVWERVDGEQFSYDAIAATQDDSSALT